MFSSSFPENIQNCPVLSLEKYVSKMNPKKDNKQGMQMHMWGKIHCLPLCPIFQMYGNSLKYIGIIRFVLQVSLYWMLRASVAVTLWKFLDIDWRLKSYSHFSINGKKRELSETLSISLSCLFFCVNNLCWIEYCS